MDFNKLRVISFAIRHRLMGYELVKNCPNKSPYYVKMVKVWHGIDDMLDTFEHKHIHSRDFSKKGTNTDKKLIQRLRYMFLPKEGDKKFAYAMNYMHKKPNGTPKYKQLGPYYLYDKPYKDTVGKTVRPEVSYDELAKRETSYINTIYGTSGAQYSQEIVPSFIPQEMTIADIEKNNYWQQVHKKQAELSKESFWATLRYNLRNN